MRALLTILLVSISSVAVSQQSDGTTGTSTISHKKKLVIQELIDLTGGASMVSNVSDQIIDGMIHSIKQNRDSEVPPRVYDIIADEVKSTIRDTLGDGATFFERLYPIYDRHFTYAELQKIADWYETPLGQKTARVMPQVMQESIQAGQMWAQQEMLPVLQERLQRRFQAEGLAQ